MNVPKILHKRKYEFLLAALLIHLFIAVLLYDLDFYTNIIWPLNMLILGIFSLGIFSEKSRMQLVFKNILLALIIFLPISIIYLKPTPLMMELINIAHIAFYCYIFIEVLRYLLKPSYINSDIVSASACGYLLLIEIGIFSMQAIYYGTTNPFKGIDTTSFTTIYLDIVYFCSITVTSIGFGDIVPSNHYAKLATSILGIAGQFYSVVLVGIMISKYTSEAGNSSKK
ncbi:Ion channel [compost metagenome]